MGKKKQPGLMPFMVLVSVVLDHYLPIAAATLDEAKEIAEDTVAKGWASDYADENDGNVDSAEPANDDQRKTYRFLDKEMNEHTF
jgi:hypothetical protein